MKKLLCILLTLFMLVFSGCSQQEAPPETELNLWVTSQPYADGYTALAREWNKEHPGQPIRLKIQIYSLERITGKLSSALHTGTRFESETIPDLMDIDYSFFWDYLSEHKTELYPLENMLKNNSVSSQVRQNAALYSSNQLCFALPYSHQQLLLCYRLDLAEELSGFHNRTDSFEDLAVLGSRAADAGVALIQSDYLGQELFLSLFLRALDTSETTEDAYQASLSLLQRMHRSGASESLTAGNAYGDAFGGLLESKKLGCFVTTAANLHSLALAHPEAAAYYGVTALPSFLGVAKDISLPAMATAVHLGSPHVVLARDFLEFCRFSEAAKAWPLLYLGGEEDPEALLQSYGSVGNLLWGSSLNASPVLLLMQKIPQYSRDLLSPTP